MTAFFFACDGPFFIWGDPPPALRWFHYAGYHPRPTDQDRRGPRPGGPQENAGTVREIDRVPDAGVPAGPARGAAERHLPRAVRRDGDRQGHRHLLHVRAPHAAVLREVPRGVHAAQAHRRAVEDRPRRGALRPAAAGPGAADAGDRDRPHGHAPAARGGGGDRGVSPLHDDARGGEAERQGGHLGDAWGVPYPGIDADGVPGADQAEPEHREITGEFGRFRGASSAGGSLHRIEPPGQLLDPVGQATDFIDGKGGRGSGPRMTARRHERHRSRDDDRERHPGQKPRPPVPGKQRDAALHPPLPRPSLRYRAAAPIIASIPDSISRAVASSVGSPNRASIAVGFNVSRTTSPPSV